MNKKIAVWAIIALFVGGAVGIPIGQMICDNSHKNETVSLDNKNVELNQAMRKLWSEHMQWTYDTVNAYFHNPDELQPTLDRLLQNQKDIGAAIVPYYGQAAGDKLASLLTAHITGAVPVLQAAKEGNDTALTKALSDWQANAKDIADFLSSANPNSWPQSATEPMMKMHIDQTVAYSVDLLKGDTAKAIKDYQAAYDHMMEMADTLTNGIAKQFPDKVKGTVTGMAEEHKS